jgi:phospholipid transport system substrate-binding protein
MVNKNIFREEILIHGRSNGPLRLSIRSYKEVSVKSSNCCRSAVLLLVFLFFGIVSPCFAGELTDQMKRTSDKFLSILSDPTLKESEKTEEGGRLIRKMLDEQFDWEEMARRSLAKYWAQRTEEEKHEFVRLYGDMVKRTFMEKVVRSYSGEKVVYGVEKVEKDYGTLNVQIVTKTNANTPVEYRLRKKGNAWLIYDVSIEGVSLVNNYRAQFDGIMSKVPYANLVKVLKDKVKDK